jgi:hypothetical protein
LKPHPHGSALILVGWIRVGKNVPQNENSQNSEEINYFEVLDVLF